MIRAKIFDKAFPTEDMERFLKMNRIERDQVISVSISTDSNAHQRIYPTGLYKILLVYDDLDISPERKYVESFYET